MEKKERQRTITLWEFLKPSRDDLPYTPFVATCIAIVSGIQLIVTYFFPTVSVWYLVVAGILSMLIAQMLVYAGTVFWVIIYCGFIDMDTPPDTVWDRLYGLPKETADSGGELSEATQMGCAAFVILTALPLLIAIAIEIWFFIYWWPNLATHF